MAKLPNLTNLSDSDLVKLQKEVEEAISSRANDNKKNALEAAKAEAKKHGFSLEDLVGSQKTKKPRTPAAPKYRHPENPEVTWSGRGRRPDWIKDAVEKGRSLEEFAI